MPKFGEQVTMPIYTYECPKGHRFEDIGTFEEKEKECWQCRTTHEAQIETAVRVPSVPAPAKFNCSMPTYQKPKTT